MQRVDHVEPLRMYEWGRHGTCRDSKQQQYIPALRKHEGVSQSKAVRDVPQSKKYKSGAGTHRNPKFLKRRETRRTPEYTKAVRHAVYSEIWRNEHSMLSSESNTSKYMLSFPLKCCLSLFILCFREKFDSASLSTQKIVTF